jgi:hypothetical protein
MLGGAMVICLSVSRLIALLSMMGHWLNRRRNPIPGRSTGGGFWSRKIENALSFNGG